MSAAEIAERLAVIASELGADELRVLLRVAERLRSGQRRYGQLHLATDRRDWQTESLEEIADAALYLCFALERREQFARDAEERAGYHAPVVRKGNGWVCPRCGRRATEHPLFGVVFAAPCRVDTRQAARKARR